MQILILLTTWVRQKAYWLAEISKHLESLSALHQTLIPMAEILFVEDTGEYLYSIDRMF